MSLTRLIEPHHPKAGRGRQPLGLERVLRTYFRQNRLDLSDPAAEGVLPRFGGQVSLGIRRSHGTVNSRLDAVVL